MNNVILECIEPHLNCLDVLALRLACWDYYWQLGQLRSDSCLRNGTFYIRYVIESNHKACKKYCLNNYSLCESQIIGLSGWNYKKYRLSIFAIDIPIYYLCNCWPNESHFLDMKKVVDFLSQPRITGILKETIRKKYIPHEKCFISLLLVYPNEEMLSWSDVNELWYYISVPLAKKILLLNFRKNKVYRIDPYMQDELLIYARSIGFQFAKYKKKIHR